MTSLDALASDIADRIICEHCDAEVRAGLEARILAAIGIKRPRRRRPIRPNWRERDRFLAPYEKRFKAGLRSIWKLERAAVLSNMRRSPLPKAFTGGQAKYNSLIDQWLYPAQKYIPLLTEKATASLSSLLKASIVHIGDTYSFGISYDLVNERALEWLAMYSPNLAGAVEAETLTTLREQLMLGIDGGENMAKLTARVHDTFEGMEKWRAERIARTETITAQERGNRFTFKEAGFAKKIWLANPDCCEICQALDGKIVDIDEPFFIDPTGYSDGQAPPRHPGGRCTSGPWADEFGG